jgi:methylmalonyl-CoA mutase C-terminal domain/subunit
LKEKRKIRVLLAKPGLDTHERGIKLVAVSLRDAGMEVIYSGVFQTKESIVQTVLQESVDIIGLSFLCGAHLELTKEIIEELKRKGNENIPVICGGIIPDEDIAPMKSLGVKEIYGPGTAMQIMINDIHKITDYQIKEYKK